MNDLIKIRGARQHNLKNVNIDIPKNEFVVITGISGSGKSSLAFDTIYAEGQRRYVESLSAYARQFLGIMDKPDVDLIEGLSPSISIDQKSASHNPRSTVGTITEIYDYLRLLYARVGHPHCPKCGRELSKLSLDEIIDRILDECKTAVSSESVKPVLFTIISPVIRSQKGEFKDLFENLLQKGYAKARVDGKYIDISDSIELIKTNKHTIEAVIYQFSLTRKQINDQIYKSNLKSNLSTYVEQTLNLSNGLIILSYGREPIEHLYSEHFSCPHCNISLSEIEPRMFSFNSPLGACDKCKGLGTIYAADPHTVLNDKLSILEGGILPFNKIFFHETWYIRLLKTVCEEEGIPMDIPINKFSKDQLSTLLKGTGKIYRVTGANRFGKSTTIFEKFEGILHEVEKRYFDNQSGNMQFEIQKYMKEEVCPSCKGDRLKPEILSITVDDQNIAQMSGLSISFLADYFMRDLTKKLNIYENQIAAPILKEITTRLSFLRNVGLAYLTVSRTAKTLSGGELQRIRLASQIGSGLTNVIYVLDEPSIGLHPKDVSALIKTLNSLKIMGNSLIIVEHDQETMEAADTIIELGPKAGKNGGKLVFQGTLQKIKHAKNSLTGQYLSGKRIIPVNTRKTQTNFGSIKLRDASQFNLKHVDAEFPLGNLIAVTGVSGSGKSSLIVETLYPALKYYLEGYYQESMGKFGRIEGYQYIDRVYLVDQSPIGRTPRSNPSTYVGFFDEIRDLFANTVDAKAMGFQKGRFSFNVKGGRCEKCQGAGVIRIEMQFLADVYITCDVCQGKRYNKETLEIRYKGKSIYEILRMTVDEACDFFTNHPKIFQKLKFLREVGLGYIELGQAAPTFSGGEAQRIKLAHELSKKGSGKTLYILDEPTTGLHFYDIDRLLKTLHELVDRGNTVIIIEHNLDVIKNCQYILDLGPEGGDKGGNLVYQGGIDGISGEKLSYTGYYLKKHLQSIS